LTFFTPIIECGAAFRSAYRGNRKHTYSMAGVNILISGDCGGKLSAMFKRVASVNKSNGPFAALLCVGGFFEPSGERRLYAKWRGWGRKGESGGGEACMHRTATT
jgi:hypothetical protein